MRSRRTRPDAAVAGAAQIAETSSGEELTEDELDELTMTWLEDEGRLVASEIANAVPVEELDND